MAEQIISPGVFTRENDLSFLPQGIGQIGAAIVGPTVKGPAFVPTVVRSFAEYERKFGSLSPDTFVPQTVREYLRNAGSVTVCRVLAGGGWKFEDTTNEFVALIASGSRIAPNATEDNFAQQTKNVLLGVIFPSKATTTPDLSKTVLDPSVGNITGNPGTLTSSGDLTSAFNLILSGSTGGTGATGGTQFSASMNPSNADYIFKQLGDDPNNSKSTTVDYNSTPGYTYLNFKSLQTSIFNTNVETATITFTESDGTYDALLTSSMEGIAGFGNAIILTTADADQYTFQFQTDNSANAAGVGLTGSLVQADITALDDPDGNATDGATISGAVLAAEASKSIGGITGIDGDAAFICSVTNNVLTIQAADAGNLTDSQGTGSLNFLIQDQGGAGIMSNQAGGSAYNSASLSITQQGTDVTGYPGLSSGRGVIMATMRNQDLEWVGLGNTEKYSYASTPFITSQFLDDNQSTKELFRFHSLMHGTECNNDYKVSIANLKEPSDIDNVEQYSQFSVIIRKYKDTDKNPLILEQFNGVTLDPDATNYIGRIIGDRYPQYNETLDKVELLGNYSNKSQYIRVEVAQGVDSKSYSPKLSPKGFSALVNPIATASLSAYCTFPSCSYESIQQTGTDGVYSSKGYLGWKFTEKNFDNNNWIKALPSTQESNVAGAFNVDSLFGHADSALWTGSLSASITSTGATGPTANQLKFSVPFQGGDDGIAPWTVKYTGAETNIDTITQYTQGDNLYGFDVNQTSAAGYVGYKKAIDILANQDEYDINMLVIPGAIHQYHSLITNKGIDMCEDRGDAFYVMDLSPKDSTVNNAVDAVGSLDTNYAAVYYPWVKVLDTAKNKPVLVPPSVVVPGAIAASDRIAAEWFAPAGLNRGVLGNVIEAKTRLNQAERDILYDNKVNPIATFPQTGVCIWGQKTLQERSTALDRINVRRLLIALKKFIASSSKYLVFEQNTTATRNRFLNIVNPYLESVQQRQGLYAFRVQMDESNNTPDIIDRNQIVGAIFIQPAKTAEFIVLDFNILPTGATFDNGGGAGGGY